MTFTLIRDADVYAPEPVGRRDVAVAAGRIVAIGERLEPLPAWADAEAVDAGGHLLVPGLVDLHMQTTVSELTIEQPGTYRFWCAEYRHLEKSMGGTLRIE